MDKFSQNLEIEDANKLCAIKNDYHNFSNLGLGGLGLTTFLLHYQVLYLQLKLLSTTSSSDIVDCILVY